VKDKQFEKLIKKNMQKVEQQKPKVRPSYDSTLDATKRPEDPAQADTEELFDQMKRREF
jgi:hypothetical protein